MRVRSVVRFLSQALTVGLAAAIVVLLLLPDSDLKTAVVEIREAASPPPVAEANGGSQGHGAGPVSYADAVAKAAAAVVNVHTSKVVTRRSNPVFDDPVFQRFFGDDPGASRRHGLETNLGSGVIISPQGYLLTNLHVIDKADEIRVALEDGRTVAATVVGTDPETDLAVLKVDLQDLPSVSLGESEDLRVGDVVLAIGNPFGVGQTVTMGIVSATGRNDLGINTFENFIQTDAAINPGNSGGALINPYGQLVGINTAIFSRSGGYQGIGFAIPVSLAKGIMRQIIEQGHVSRGWLGVEIQEVTPALAESFGLTGRRGIIVAGVLQDGPAKRAGVQPGDVILAIDEEAVESARDALNAITERPPGSTLRLNVVRDGTPREIRVQVAERPALEER
jgi:serine protease DegS